MACLTLNGISAVCGGSQGGIKSVFIIEYDTIGTITEADGIVTGITYVGSPATGAWYTFLKDNSNFTEAIVGDGILASIHYQPTVNLVFRKMSATLSEEIMQLAQGDVVIFIEDSNGTYWMIGSDRGLSLSASAGGQTGSVLEELNGETLAFTGKETRKAYTVDQATWDALPV